ncbi:hypothetical protein IV46_GL000560 [Limosilactobacillus fermentum]|nr:hypothetical protein IV46_GL000560 [Limosilactobacillus fermentum]
MNGLDLPGIIKALAKLPHRTINLIIWLVFVGYLIHLGYQAWVLWFTTTHK